MYGKLTNLEVGALLVAINHEPLGKNRHQFEKATRKLRLGTGTVGELPEHILDCDYSLSWFRLHKEAGLRLIDRYQMASDASVKAYWAARRET